MEDEKLVAEFKAKMKALNDEYSALEAEHKELETKWFLAWRPKLLNKSRTILWKMSTIVQRKKAILRSYAELKLGPL